MLLAEVLLAGAAELAAQAATHLAVAALVAAAQAVPVVLVVLIAELHMQAAAGVALLELALQPGRQDLEAAVLAAIYPQAAQGHLIQAVAAAAGQETRQVRQTIKVAATVVQVS